MNRCGSTDEEPNYYFDEYKKASLFVKKLKLERESRDLRRSHFDAMSAICILYGLHITGRMSLVYKADMYPSFWLARERERGREKEIHCEAEFRAWVCAQWATRRASEFNAWRWSRRCEVANNEGTERSSLANSDDCTALRLLLFLFVFCLRFFFLFISFIPLSRRRATGTVRSRGNHKRR